MTKRKKNTRERRALVGALCTAAVIVAGSTFAWFTSQDEVTNRLSASAEYGVAIAESFQPPETWVPGQEINKDASAVNTGNVDAFVRMWLDGSIRLMNQYRGGTSTAVDADVAWSTTNSKFDLDKLTDTEDSNLVSMGLTKRVNDDGDNSNAYVKTLTRQQTLNPRQAAELNSEGYAKKVEGAYSEVQAMQSGILAYAPDEAEYTYLLKEETELKIYLKSTVNGAEDTGYKSVQVPAGTLVHVGASSPTAATLTDGTLSITATETVKSTSGATNATAFNVVYVEAQEHDDEDTFFTPVNVEYESFTPMTDGLYLFLRNEKDADQTEPEFSGYYMVGYDGDEDDAYTNATFYALNTNTQLDNRSDYTVKGAEEDDVNYYTPVTVTYDDSGKNIISVIPNEYLELYCTKYEEIDADKLSFYATAVDVTNSKQTIYAVYDANGDTTFNGDEDIIVVIDLANVVTTVGNNAETWTSIGNDNTVTAYTITSTLKPAIDASKLKFYYNNDVEAGDSTAKLVDKVTLYGGVTNKAYLAFDFDLNVHLDSVQVTFDEAGKELDTAIAASKGEEWKGSKATGGATGARDSETANEITKVTWTATT